MASTSRPCLAARLLFVAKKDQAALAKVRQAIEQGKGEPEPYVALVQFLHARQ